MYNIPARTIFSELRVLNGRVSCQSSAPGFIFLFLFFLSITLKKICFPIDAKRFPIDGDMQIVEFLYAPGHFSFTRTKASPLLLPRKRRNFPLPVESGQDLNIIVGRSNYFSIGKISKLGHAAIVP